MVFIKWEQKYSVGIPEIDLQHRFFFLLIERLDTLINQRCEKIHISNLMDELAKYAVFHFASEENRMLITQYDGLYLHKVSHLELIQQLNNVKVRFDFLNSGTETIVPFLTDWLINHTTLKDLEFGDYLRKIGNTNAECKVDADG